MGYLYSEVLYFYIVFGCYGQGQIKKNKAL